ncbi:hypothetical protein BT63DRAFT_449586 [Microthyrium microscopicum]|uniref:Zn(2)-C6 fungal-type domain-containing protein n=1 Tax=Microthyrium microscopicum TaxID=703497 RepID=A0A6A6UQN9_9PEZI|nr:hypothetical protein BT63DRAFT_449586 [Microthyrium microscopicum]
MPKLRETCTRCSRRRQKCDKQIPCWRCVRDGVGASCSRSWGEGYDARVHRTYPKDSGTNPSEPNSRDGTILHTTGPPTPAPAAPQSGLTGTPDGDKVFLQSLVPQSLQILQLVDYHELQLLWSHNCLNGPVFRREVASAIKAPGGLQVKNLDLRWTALLFAVMASSLTCAPASFLHNWGFPESQRRTLSERWYKATISCLNLGTYISKPHVYSLQAILVATNSANIIGYASEQFILYGALLRMAQGLGLNRLPLSPELDDLDSHDGIIPQSRRENISSREVGRRLWKNICIQDWLSTQFSGMVSISKQQFTTSIPRRIDDESLRFVDERTPLGIDYTQYVYEVSSLLADFYGAIGGISEDAQQYEIILKFDTKIRALGVGSMATCFNYVRQPARHLPWVDWARRAAIMFQASKTMSLHRNFLLKSFTEPKYAYTRWVSITTSKIVLREAEADLDDPESPKLWTTQAQVVVAARTLCLDIRHRSETEPEYAEHRELIERALDILHKYGDSALASKGIQLITSILRTGRPPSQESRDTSMREVDNNSQDHEEHPVTWPLDSQMSASNMKQHGPETPESLPPAGSGHFTPQRLLQDGSTTVTDASHTALYDAALQQPPHFDIMSSSGATGFGAYGTHDVPIIDLFSDYIPSRNGFDDAFFS